MINQHPIVISLKPYTEDIRISTVKAYKYFRSVKQFNMNEAASKRVVSLFMKKIKTAKIVRSFKLQLNSWSKVRIQSALIQNSLKFHSQTLRELDISALPSSKSSFIKSPFFPMKKLSSVHIYDNLCHIKALTILRKVENLFIKASNTELRAYSLLYKALVRFNNLKHLCLLIFPNCLNNLLIVLNEFSTKFDRPIKFQILTKDEHDYNDLPDLSLCMLQKVSKINLEHLSSESVLKKLYSGQNFYLTNLRSLKLRFSVPDLELISYLRHLQQITQLDKLSLSFTEYWDAELVKGVFKSLQLPVLLQDLKIAMPLLFKDLLAKYVNGVEIGKKVNNKCPWRANNFFEEEPIFTSFFHEIKQANNLNKVEFVFQMIENFSSYYTNFFISIVNRLPNLSNLVINVTDYTLQEDFTDQISEGFDMALLFQACSTISKLEHLEILMPNLFFEDSEIDHTMVHLKSLAIGVTENEEEGVLKFQNVSKVIKSWLKRLLSIAPNLKSLVLDFTEVIEEPTFLKRFMLIERFKQLEDFCSRFKIEQCSAETAKKVGKIMQSFEKLNTIVLRFVESEKNVLEIKKFLNYQRPLRDFLVSFDQKNWVGKDDD